MYFHWYCLTHFAVLRSKFLQPGCFEGSKQSSFLMVLICLIGKKSKLLYLIMGWQIQNYQEERINRKQYCPSIAIPFQTEHHAKINSLEMKIDCSVVFNRYDQVIQLQFHVFWIWANDFINLLYVNNILAFLSLGVFYLFLVFQ